MNSKEIYNLLHTIGAAPGKNDKIAMLEAHKDDETLKRVLKAALDPLVSYGVKQLPPMKASIPGRDFDDTTWALLDDLQTRRKTGNDAQTLIAVEFSFLNIESACLLRDILTKNLGVGIGDTSVNRVWKGLLKSFPYMRCSLPKDMKLGDEFGWKDGAWSQLKADGLFINLDIDDYGTVRLSSRQGQDFPMGQFENFADVAANVFNWGTQTHGEMVVLKDGIVLPREEGNGIMNSISHGGEFPEGCEPQFLAWDQIPQSAVVPKGKYEVPYSTRFAELSRQVKDSQHSGLIRLIPTKAVYSLKEAWAHYAEMLKAGYEGTVFKAPHGTWKDGTSKHQGKLKLSAPCELKVVGYNEGTGKNAGSLGSIQCESACGKLHVDVNGRSDEMRADWWSKREALLGSVITVTANSIMAPQDENDVHSLFLPVFVELRTDKDSADTLEQVKDQFQAAIDSVSNPK